MSNLWEIFDGIYEDNGGMAGTFQAPGRVNLIGEHTDYNDGFVLPMAIEREVTMLAQLRTDRYMRIHSLDFSEGVEIDLDEIKQEKEKTWANYVIGVADELQKSGYAINGMNLLFTGNIPQGSGLSSSAALEVVTAFMFKELCKLDIKPVDIARLCQRAENDFVGVKCGIMDQYISMMGRKNYVLFIDCRTDEYELIPMNNQYYKIVICDSKKKRGLVDSEYNRRRSECESVVDFFDKKLEKDVKALRDINMDELLQYKNKLTDIHFRRARHVIGENDRVVKSVTALKKDDFKGFGQLMNSSHISLRDDYEVSCAELDLLVELAQKQKGVLGSRMTGAGFGGCTVSLVHKDNIEDFKKNVSDEYRKEFGKTIEIYTTSPAEGARKVE